MLAVGMLISWTGYSVSLWGWCLLRGYNVTLGQLMTPLHPYAGKWPPGLIPDTQIFPGGAGGHPQVPFGSAVGAAIAQGAGQAAAALKPKPQRPQPTRGAA